MNLSSHITQLILTAIGSICFFVSCKKSEPKGDVILKSDFSSIENWVLYSEYHEDDSLFTRVEDGLLKLKTYSRFSYCQRATHQFSQDFSNIEEIHLAIYFKQLILPENIAFHVYCAIGAHEFRAVIEKQQKSAFTLWMKLKNETLYTNIRGVVLDKTTAKKEKDEETIDFIQLSLCGSGDTGNTELIYCEIEKVILTVE